MDNYSILMSIYSKVDPKALKLSLSSIVHQSFKPNQIIVVWDGPVSQQLHEIVDSISVDNPGIFTEVNLKKNHGLAYALNAGLEVSRNDLIARMDSDDYSLPERCEKQVIEFEKDPDLVLLGTQIKFFRDSPDIILNRTRAFPTETEDIRRVLRKQNPFSHPSVMFRRATVLQCGGYNPNLRRRQDYELFSRMIIHFHLKGRNLSDTLLLFRADEDYKRRNKNIESCRSRIKVQYMLYKRHDCSLGDFLYILLAMLVTMVIPSKLYDIIYTKLIWKNKSKQ